VRRFYCRHGTLICLLVVHWSHSRTRIRSRRCQHYGEPKVEPRSLSLAMLVSQMSIHLADENAAVFVAHPACDRHEVNARHNGVRNKVMAQIMKAEFLE